MSTGEVRDLQRRASALGIQTDFVDSGGRRRMASVETLRKMISLLGGEAAATQSIPHVIVCWGGRERSVMLGKVQSSGKTATSLPLLDGKGHGERELQVRITAGKNSSAVAHLPALPFGYYEWHVQTSGREQKSLIISAPDKAYAPPGFRAWGIFAPMYSIHSKASWGAGTLTDWQRLCESLTPLEGRAPRVLDSNSSLSSARESGHRGARPSTVVAATLPLLGAFLEKWKCEPSPYSPATRLFWNEFHLDVSRVPEFAASKTAQRLANSTPFLRDVAQLRSKDVVDYGREMALKRRILEQLTSEFFRKQSPRRSAFEEFAQRHPELDRYAAFRAVCEARSQSWLRWPDRLRDGQINPGDYDHRIRRYHTFAQWLAQEQMNEVLARCRERGVQFYLDLPLGVDPDGYDVWANQHLFVNEASVGAPPDTFFTKGQNWNFPPLHPQRIREKGYRYVIDYLRFQMRHTGLLRLDHVMGLHRLWWVPRGVSAAEGAYVSYSAEELYAILCLESHRHQTMLIGENLGTVPPEVNRSMKRHGLRTMYVAQYEAQPKAKPLREPPRDCVASLNTHDMPTFAAFWRGLDIADRQKLGLMQASEARAQRKRRAELREALVRYLQRKRRSRHGVKSTPFLKGAPTERNILAALLKFLARSEAEVVLVNLEDLWLETRPQNTPGTSTERVNWRRKMKLSMEELLANRAVQTCLKAAQR